MQSIAENLMRRITLGDCLRRTAKRYPRKIALTYQDRRTTYEQFNELANRFANAMTARGYSKGSKIAFLGLNCSEFLFSLFGCAKAGFIFVPLNPLLRPEELFYAADHADVEAIIMEENFTPTVCELLPRLPKIQSVVRIDRGGGKLEGMLDYEELLSQGTTEEPEVLIDERDAVEILYTGGTTSFPRAAVLTHLGLVMSTTSIAMDFRSYHTDVNLTVMPLFHVAQLVATLSAILTGGSNVIMPWVDFKGMLEVIEKERITLFFLVSTMYRFFMDEPDFDKYDLSSLRIAFYFGAVMPESLQRECMERIAPDIGLGFGQTEMSPTASTFKPEDQLRKAGSLGNSSIFVEMEIMDEAGNILPRMQIGEIVYRSPHLMEGYYNDPASNEAAFQDGWFHSGDLAYMDEDGFLFFVDRKKDLIKSGGENLASIEVERCIYTDERVQEAYVIGLPHERWGEAVTAVIVPREGSGLTEQDVIDHCKRNIANYKVPKAVIFASDLPRSATGKTLKYMLRQQLKDYYTKGQ
jgi:acyl-CoA synthetase (AMP-forming)/AMP-acid ligase II